MNKKIILNLAVLTRVQEKANANYNDKEVKKSLRKVKCSWQKQRARGFFCSQKIGTRTSLLLVRRLVTDRTLLFSRQVMSDSLRRHGLQ